MRGNWLPFAGSVAFLLLGVAAAVQPVNALAVTQPHANNILLSSRQNGRPIGATCTASGPQCASGCCDKGTCAETSVCFPPQPDGAFCVASGPFCASLCCFQSRCSPADACFGVNPSTTATASRTTTTASGTATPTAAPTPTALPCSTGTYSNGTACLPCTSTSTAPTCPAPEATSWFNSLSTGAQAGFIIGVILGGLLLIGLAWWIWRKCSQPAAAAPAKEIVETMEKEAPAVAVEVSDIKAAAAGTAPPVAEKAAEVGSVPAIVEPASNRTSVIATFDDDKPSLVVTTPTTIGTFGTERPMRGAELDSMNSIPAGATMAAAATLAGTSNNYGSRPLSTASLGSTAIDPQASRPPTMVLDDDALLGSVAPRSRTSYASTTSRSAAPIDPATAAAVAAGARPRSMFAPGPMPTSRDRPTTGVWDGAGHFSAAPKDFAPANGAPIFVGPDGAYYVAGANGMEKLTPPPGFYPAPLVVMQPNGGVGYDPSIVGNRSSMVSVGSKRNSKAYRGSMLVEPGMEAGPSTAGAGGSATASSSSSSVPTGAPATPAATPSANAETK